MSDTENSVMQNYLESEHGGEQDDYYKPTVGEFHASTTGSCVRRLYFDFMKPQQPDDGAWKHFELGNRMEEIFEDALARRYGEKYVVNRVPIEVDVGDFKIVGETDPVVIDDNLDVQELWEVKSTLNLSYVRDKPKWPHVTQLHAYAYGLDLLNSADSRKIVYIDKTSLETVVHDVSFEQGIWEHVIDKLETVYEALMTGEPPEPAEEKHQDHFCPHDDEPYCCKNVSTDDDSDSNDGWGR